MLSPEDRVALRECMTKDFSLDDMRDLCFDLALDYDDFPQTSLGAFCRELILWYERRSTLACLITELVKRRADEMLTGLLAKAGGCDPRKKVQLVLSSDVVAKPEVRLALAQLLGVTIDQVAIIGSAPGSTRLLIGLPADAAERLLALGITELDLTDQTAPGPLPAPSQTLPPPPPAPAQQPAPPPAAPAGCLPWGRAYRSPSPAPLPARHPAGSRAYDVVGAEPYHALSEDAQLDWRARVVGQGENRGQGPGARGQVEGGGQGENRGAGAQGSAGVAEQEGGGRGCGVGLGLLALVVVTLALGGGLWWSFAARVQTGQVTPPAVAIAPPTAAPTVAPVIGPTAAPTVVSVTGPTAAPTITVAPPSLAPAALPTLTRRPPTLTPPPTLTTRPTVTATTTSPGLSDAFAYCAAVGTVDAPDARYTGPKVPEAVARGLEAAFGKPPSQPLDPVWLSNSVWRCMDGRVYACNVGANLPCTAKADTSRAPTPAMADFCKQNPDAKAIPAVVTGRSTVYTWQCVKGEAVVAGQWTKPDARGFLATIWYLINSVGAPP